MTGRSNIRSIVKIYQELIISSIYREKCVSKNRHGFFFHFAHLIIAVFLPTKPTHVCACVYIAQYLKKLNKIIVFSSTKYSLQEA